jgi:hypothetical protein
MPMSLAELKALLDVDEPDYVALAQIGASILPHLQRLATSGQPHLASKAVSLAGMIGGAKGLAVVTSAAASADAVIRVAAAHAAAHLRAEPGVATVLGRLLRDKDVGVIKVAARSAEGITERSVRTLLTRATSTLAAAQAQPTRTSGERATVSPAKKTATKATAAKKATKATARAGKPAGAARKAAPAPGGEMPTGTMSEPARAPRGTPRGEMPSGTMG